MFFLPKQPVETRPRTRANRLVGRIWLCVLFIFLTANNLANSSITPMLGTMAPLFKAALIVSTLWNGVLLASIGCGHGWARYILAGFLFSFVIGQTLFIVNLISEHPALHGDPINLMAIISASYILAGAWVLVSKDIRQISHHVIN